MERAEAHRRSSSSSTAAAAAFSAAAAAGGRLRNQRSQCETLQTVPLSSLRRSDARVQLSGDGCESRCCTIEYSSVVGGVRER